MITDTRLSKSLKVLPPLRDLVPSNQVKFAIVFFVVNLHLLRNVSLVLYLALYLLMVAFVWVEYILSGKSQSLSGRGIAFHLWVATSIFAFATSLILISPSGAAQGLSRFLFAAPIFMALVVYTDNIADLRKHFITFAGFFALASLSLPLQFFIGPVSWFAEASERGGYVRYASLLGSLPTIGVIVGAYIVLTQCLSAKLRLFFLPLMIIPAIISLNKSAIVNVAIGVLILIFLNRRSIPKLATGGVALALLVAIGAFFLPGLDGRVAVSLQSFGGLARDSTVVNNDTSVIEGALDRIITLPKANFDALSELHSPFVYLTGAGYGMGNTALVPASDVLAPMAHNQFAEQLTIFGPIAGGIQLIVIFMIGNSLRLSYARTHQRVYLIVFWVFLLTMINSVFANGTLYQPAGASIFYLSLFVAVASDVLDNRVPGGHDKVNPRG